MLFKQGTAVYSYEVMREAGQNVMYINYLGSSFVPNIAESPEVMARTVMLLKFLIQLIANSQYLK